METELFIITFTDDTKLWANVNNKYEVSFSTYGKGINLIIKEFMQKIPYSKLCYFATEHSKTSKFVKDFVDVVELKSTELQNQLLKAF